MTDFFLEAREVGRLGTEIYDGKLRAILESKDCGRFVAIDVKSQDYEVDDDDYQASERLRSRHPDARVYVKRVGFPAAFTYRSPRVVS